MFGKKITRVTAAATTLALVLSCCEVALAAGSGPTKGSGNGSNKGSSGGQSGKGQFNKQKGSGSNHHHHNHGHHWSYSRYYSSYGCTLYYDEGEQTYYYWCQPDSCYYATSYCPYGQYSWNE
jgi:hypothetical protein